jgi:DNA-binding LytR/AlgR family response regulator
MTALNFLVQRKPPETHASPAGAPAPRFLDRLPPRLRGAEIRAVEAQDHYLRLHTSKGEDLILLRLSDAVAELEGIEGAQTHRSWWVAKNAVEDARRNDGRAILSLRGGIEAPVSRAYAKALRDAGWF